MNKERFIIKNNKVWDTQYGRIISLDNICNALNNLDDLKKNLKLADSKIVELEDDLIKFMPY